MKRIVPFLRLSTQKGLTLLELIVSLTIGLFLLMAMAMTYNIGFKVSQQVSDIANLHANARAVFERIGRDLRMAGYVDLMDKPTTPFGTCLTFSDTKNTYASHTLNFETDLVNRIYSRAVDKDTDSKIDRTQLSALGYISCGQMLPVVGCDSEFALNKPSARQLLPSGTDFTQLCVNNPSTSRYNSNDENHRKLDSQIQIAYQVQSVGGGDYVSLRNAAEHRTDTTGVNLIDATASNNPLDCTGNPIPEDANGFVVNRYRIFKETISGKQYSRLQCIGNNAKPDQEWAEIADNIHEFKLRYRLGATEANDVELKNSRTSVIAVENRIASELNRNIGTATTGYANLDDTDMAWSRVVGVEVCLIVAGEPSDGIIPSNMAESQELIPTCARDATNRELYASGTPRQADDKKYYLRLTKTFAVPNSIYQFEVNH